LSNEYHIEKKHICNDFFVIYTFPFSSIILLLRLPYRCFGVPAHTSNKLTTGAVQVRGGEQFQKAAISDLSSV